MQFVVEAGQVGWLDVEKGVGSCCWFLQINNYLFLLNRTSIDVETVPLTAISAVAPIVSADSVSPMHEDVHEVILLISAFNVIEFFFDAGQFVF